MDDYLERLFGYREVGWCIRPSTIYAHNVTSDQDGEEKGYAIGGPMDAALHGWRVISPGEGIECVTCHARHYIPWPMNSSSTLLSPSEEMESQHQLLTLYHDKIVSSGHERACPWRRRGCDEGFVRRRMDDNVEGFVERDGERGCVYACSAHNQHTWLCPYSQKEQKRVVDHKILLSPLTLESLSHYK